MVLALTCYLAAVADADAWKADEGGKITKHNLEIFIVPTRDLSCCSSSGGENKTKQNKKKKKKKV